MSPAAGLFADVANTNTDSRRLSNPPVDAKARDGEKEGRDELKGRQERKPLSDCAMRARARAYGILRRDVREDLELTLKRAVPLVVETPEGTLEPTLKRAVPLEPLVRCVLPLMLKVPDVGAGRCRITGKACAV